MTKDRLTQDQLERIRLDRANAAIRLRAWKTAKLLERLVIADDVNAKTKYPLLAGLCGDLLASGDVDLAVQQKPELLQVRGIEVLGLLPGDLHMVTVFVACVEASSAEPATGQAPIDFPRLSASAAVFRAKGLDPA